MAGISKAERERRAAAATGADESEIGADGDPGDEHVDHEQDQAPSEPDGDAITLILMARDGHFAEVHPLEVNNYSEGGWLPVED